MAFTTIRSAKHRIGLSVVGDGLRPRIKLHLLASSHGDVGQMDQGCRLVADLDIRRGPPPG